MTPILLVPGLMCTTDVFVPQMGTLWQNGPVMVANTLDGDTIGAMATSILEDAPPRFALLGYSMGGYIAQEIMRQAPDRVDRLCLMSTAATPETDEQTTNRKALIESARNSELGMVLKKIYPDVLIHPDRKGESELIDIAVSMAREVGLDRAIEQEEAIMARIDSRPSLSDITVPTLVIVGDDDRITPVERSREIASGIDGSELVIVERSGHFLPLERPTEVNDALHRWLTD